MADQIKIYVPKSSAKSKTFDSGKTIIKLSFKAADLVDFINQHANEKGYINFGVSERRNVSQYGDTHCIWLDTWQPSAKSADQKPRTLSREEVQQGLREVANSVKPSTPETDDVPF